MLTDLLQPTQCPPLTPLLRPPRPRGPWLEPHAGDGTRLDAVGETEKKFPFAPSSPARKCVASCSQGQGSFDQRSFRGTFLTSIQFRPQTDTRWQVCRLEHFPSDGSVHTRHLGLGGLQSLHFSRGPGTAGLKASLFIARL